VSGPPDPRTGPPGHDPAPAVGPPALRIADDLQGRVRVGLIHAAPVAVAAAGTALEAEIDAACRRLAAEHAGRAPAEVEDLQPARDLYRVFGIDPTRTRPSSEALLRRVLKGQGLPRILNAVDVCNLCALLFLLSIGLYDAGRIRGPVTLRRGRPGESYPGIRKDEVHLEGRPVLADEEGPFGNPTSDSLRTSVTPSTTSIWMVIFAPAATPPATLRRHVATAADLLARHAAPAGATAAIATGLLPGA
jgi:DNA/RNA-binding domain of Phe-tRNA-synthetase-like protein